MESRFEIRVVTKQSGMMELWISTAPNSQWLKIGQSTNTYDIVEMFNKIMRTADSISQRAEYVRNSQYYEQIRDNLEDGKWYLVGHQRIIAQGDEKESIPVDANSIDYLLVCKGYEIDQTRCI